MLPTQISPYQHLCISPSYFSELYPERSRKGVVVLVRSSWPRHWPLAVISNHVEPQTALLERHLVATSFLPTHLLLMAGAPSEVGGVGGAWGALSDDELEAEVWAHLSDDDVPMAWAGLEDDDTISSADDTEKIEDPRVQEVAPVDESPVAEPEVDDYQNGLQLALVPTRGRKPKASACVRLVQATFMEQAAHARRIAHVESAFAHFPPYGPTEEGLPRLDDAIVSVDHASQLCAYVSHYLRLIPRPVRFSPIGTVLEQLAWTMSAVRRGELDGPRLKADLKERQIVEHFLFTKTKTMSLSVEADVLGADPNAVRRTRTLAVFAAMQMHAHDVVRMLKSVADDVRKGGGRCLVLYEKYKGDEAQFKVTVSDLEFCHAQPGASSSETKLALSSAPVALLSKQAAPTRILQSHRSLAAVFAPADAPRFALHADIPIQLQVMSSCKMDVYAQCYSVTRLPLRGLYDMFDRKALLHVTDGDNAVGAALRGVLAHDKTLTCWHQKCHIHKLSHVAAGCMGSSVAQAQVSGLVNFALSLGKANVMREFREALRVVLAGKLSYRKGRPRACDLARNWRILLTCVPGDSRTQHLRRAIVWQVLNGNWEHEKVEHVCWGCCADKDNCLEKVVSVIVACISPATPKRFPRQKWTGAVESVNFPLLLLLVHNVLPVAYGVWAALKPGARPKEHAERLEEVHVGAGGVAATAGVAMVADLPGGEGAHASERAGYGPNPQVDASAGGARGDGEGNASAAEHSAYRRAALGWLAADPAGILYVVRQVLGPLDECMGRYLKAGGQTWQQQQDVAEAMSDPLRSTSSRTFVVCLAESGQLVGDAPSKLSSLLTSEEHWRPLPLRFCHSSMRARACLMLSQAACGLYALAQESLAYPLRLFGLLRDDPAVPEAIAEDYNERPCLFDAFSLAFVAYHLERGLKSSDSVAELTALAMMMELDTSSVEALHASVRRLVTALSVQTHTENVLDASAEWGLRRLRIIARSAPVDGASTAQMASGDGAADAREPLLAKGRGGAWRAFVREETLGARGRPDLRDLAELYKAVDPERKRKLQRRGKLATQRGRQGHLQTLSASSFGLTTRQQIAHAAKRARAGGQLGHEAFADELRGEGSGFRAVRPRLADGSSSSRLVATAQPMAGGAVDVAAGTLVALGKQRQMERRDALQKQKAGRDALAKYHREQAPRVVAEAMRAHQ